MSIAYRIEIQTKAKRQLKSFEGTTQERIRRGIDQLKSDPRGSNCKPLKGFHGIWRLRVGDYRVIYSIKDDQLLVLVLEVGHRREVYRDF